MAAAARRLAINPFGNQYPDNDTTKEIVLQADGLVAENPDDRHVLLQWTNGVDLEGNSYTQIIHLTGGPGNYQFHTPQVKIDSDRSTQGNTSYVLGQYTRAQRDQIIALAKAVKFNKKSRVNNCQTWMRDLLEAMVNNGLLSSEIFKKLDAGVPLKKRVPELSQ
ncbi:hypothetical protein F5J12DRAFT_577002 [Pisolithus orientalis]|uniref:uncharacterized protein n=1 Tax=Pisolithus orientalis TaxID=936130 RepID=UPI00222427ED|nr:uncharacterized protein F5J12DRAFT_577002 [Pisolithus orientalis]KAI5986695.1 hypothetical protein F5J12DRAFT_577002 [Pisolithus orientalis]